MSNFVIFASARTGSTSLAKTLAESSGVKMGFEPFNTDFIKWNPSEKNYADLVHKTGNPKAVFDEIFTQFNAIKTLDYQLPKEKYFQLLGEKDLKILFLRRKKLFDQIISDLVAHQTKMWQKGDITVLPELKALDPLEFRKKIEYVKHLNNIYGQFLEKERKDDYLSLYYEEIYSESIEENVKRVGKICEFLAIPKPAIEVIETYMVPSRARINQGNIYERVPNYKELKDKFVEYD